MKTLSQFTAALGVVISLFLGANMANAQAVLTPYDGPRIDLGTIPVGQPVTFYLDFENTGNQPLVIEHARGQHRDIKIQKFDQIVFPGVPSYIEGTVLARVANRRYSRLTLYTSIGVLNFDLHWNAQ